MALIRPSHRIFKMLYGILLVRGTLSTLFWITFCHGVSDFNPEGTLFEDYFKEFEILKENFQSDTCSRVELLWIVDNFNIFFRNFQWCDTKVFEYLFDSSQFFDVRLCDIFGFVIWYQLYFLWPKSTTVLAKKKKRKEKNQLTNIQMPREDAEVDWFWHSCLYGHKENLKKILDKHGQDIKINETNINGNTGMHLGVYSGHLPVAQILLSKYDKSLNLSIRNDDGQNPLDVAVLRKHGSIIKLLLKHTKPEISSLVFTVETEQHYLVSKFCESLKEPLEKHIELKSPLERFVVVCKEMELKSTSKERREICRNNLDVYKNVICSHLKKLYYTAKPKSDLPEESEPDKKSEKSDKEVEKSEEDVLSEFECPVCFELMSWPKRIYSCTNDHYICSLCLTDTKMDCCPQCRENFNTIKPKIRLTSEKVLKRFLKKP